MLPPLPTKLQQRPRSGLLLLRDLETARETGVGVGGILLPEEVNLGSEPGLELPWRLKDRT